MADSPHIPFITITAADHAFFGSIFRSLGYRVEREIGDSSLPATSMPLSELLLSAADSFDAWRRANGLTASGRGTPPQMQEKPVVGDTEETIPYCVKTIDEIPPTTRNGDYGNRSG